VTTLVTPSAEHLDLDLDARCLAPHSRVGRRRFPDGEVFVRVTGVAEVHEVFVVHSGQPHPNRGLAYLHGTLSLSRSTTAVRCAWRSRTCPTAGRAPPSSPGRSATPALFSGR
jgi:phosphoribosylpyrophosphate synthetase